MSAVLAPQLGRTLVGQTRMRAQDRSELAVLGGEACDRSGGDSPVRDDHPAPPGCAEQS